MNNLTIHAIAEGISLDEYKKSFEFIGSSEGLLEESKFVRWGSFFSQHFCNFFTFENRLTRNQHFKKNNPIKSDHIQQDR
jgi:hypothetical protein